MGEIFSAAPLDRLVILEGNTAVERTFRSVRLAIDQMLRGKIAKRPILSTEPAVLDYLRISMAFEPVERLRVLFLNASNELIADELHGVGSVSAVHVFPREIVKRSLEVGATALVLAHNHPSGNPAPSRADIELTRLIVEAAHVLGIAIHDHLVIARRGWVSFRREGYL